MVTSVTIGGATLIEGSSAWANRVTGGRAWSIVARSAGAARTSESSPVNVAATAPSVASTALEVTYSPCTRPISELSLLDRVPVTSAPEDEQRLDVARPHPAQGPAHHRRCP